MNTKKPSKSGRSNVRLPSDLAEEVAAAAEQAGMSLSDYHRHALRQALDADKRLSELAGFEERVSSQLVRAHQKITKLHQDQQLMFAYLDQFVKIALTLEPDLQQDTRGAAKSLGVQRYKSLIDSIPSALDGGLRKAIMPTNTDGGTDLND